MEDRGSEKRARLIEAASKMINRQGYNQTTLADIARESDVPLGNIYYYFKTKEDLGRALLADRAEYYRSRIAAWDEWPDPKRRLSALIDEVESERAALAASGCPIGSLCQELHKDGGALADEATGLLAALLAWAKRQFRELGKGTESDDLALHLVTVLQGASLLAHAFNQPDLVLRETTRLKKWLDAIVSDRGKNRTTGK